MNGISGTGKRIAGLFNKLVLLLTSYSERVYINKGSLNYFSESF